MVHEIEDEDAGVQDDGLPILSVDKDTPGWRRLTQTRAMMRTSFFFFIKKKGSISSQQKHSEESTVSTRRASLVES